MNIVILQGSPNRDGSTAILADEFARGAAEVGVPGFIIERSLVGP